MTGATRPAEFSAQINRMFDAVAPRYDMFNTLMTGGLDRQWRRRAASLTGAALGDQVLDVCCGTGELALELAEIVGPEGAVTACDFSAQMLARAARKAQRRNTPAVTFERADALALPYEDNSFAAATVGFGLHNLADHEGGLSEMTRVVRPGGAAVVLEFTRPSRYPFKVFYDLWFDRLVPVLGRLSSDPAAYSYLPASVRSFPDPAELAAMLVGAGLGDIRYRILAGGIVAIHRGTKL